jgi:hypothetical protein
MATVQTLVEQGTFIIDRTEFNRTGDKVFIDGHFYSDKTPAVCGGHKCLPVRAASLTSHSIRRSVCPTKTGQPVAS